MRRGREREGKERKRKGRKGKGSGTLPLTQMPGSASAAPRLYNTPLSIPSYVPDLACQFWRRSLKGFWHGEGSNFGLFH